MKQRCFQSTRVLNKSIGYRMFIFLGATMLAFLLSASQSYASDSKTQNSAENLSQQQSAVSGKVVDTSGQSLPGVTVVVVGTTNGSITSIDGDYTINNVPSDATLQFTFVGMKSQNIAVGGKQQINVTMEEETIGLEEIVATGYAMERKKDIIGSVSTVSTDEMLTTPAANMTSQLQGRVAGLSVSSDGSPGGTSKVRIRGFGSFGNAEPLYIIDGVPGSIDRLNPNDIESVQVLKDAASSAVYGARAANGVIIVTTKQGKKGSVQIDFDSYYGVNFVSKDNFPELLDAQEWGDLYWKAMEGAGRSYGDDTWTQPQYGTGATAVIPEYILVNNNGSRTGGTALEALRLSDPAAFAAAVDPDNYDFKSNQIVKSGNTDWFDEVYNPASVQSYQMSASGGSDAGTYVIGLGYFDQKSTSNEYAYYKRYTIRANSNLQVTDYLKIGENLQFSYNEQNDNTYASAAWTMQSLLPVYDIAGNPASSAAPGIVSVGDTGRNPITEGWRNRFDKDATYGVFGNAYAELTPIKDLVIRSAFGFDYSANTDKDLTQVTYEHAENTTPPNTLSWTMNNRMNWTLTNTATYTKKIGLSTFKLLLGTEAINNHYQTLTGARQDLLIDDNDDYLVLDAATGAQTSSGTFERSTLASYFGRLDYNYNDKYIVNATVRRDGSSKFGSNNRYGYFPSAAIGWRVSSESFMEDVDWIDDLKVRASYGIIGNLSGLSAENQYTTYAQGLADSYPIYGTNTTIAQSYARTRIGNPDARWEKATSSNIGIDATMLDGSLIVNFEYFVKETKDLLVENQAAYTGADVDLPHVNAGNIKNNGIELTVTKRGKVGQLEYEVSGNFAAYKNEATKVLDNPDATLAGGGTRLGDVTLTRQGSPISMFYGYQLDGFYNTEEEVADYLDSYTNNIIPAAIGRWRIKDVSGADGVPDNIINDYDRTDIGSPHPDFQMGVNLSLAYKGFDFTGFVFWNQGGDLFNFSRYNVDFNTFQYQRSARMLYDSWTPDNTNAMLPILDLNDSYSNTYASSYFVEDASYVRVKTLQLGYTFPQTILDKIGVRKLRLYVQAENLFTFTKFSGLDPGLSMSSDANDTAGDLSMGVVNNYNPTPKQILFGINFGL